MDYETMNLIFIVTMLCIAGMGFGEMIKLWLCGLGLSLIGVAVAAVMIAPIYLLTLIF